VPSLMDKLSLLHLLLIFTAIACMALLASLIRFVIRRLPIIG